MVALLVLRGDLSLHVVVFLDQSLYACSSMR